MHQHPAYVGLSVLGRAHLSGTRPLAAVAGHRPPGVRTEGDRDYEPRGELGSATAASRHSRERLPGQVPLETPADQCHLGVTQDPPLQTPELRHRTTQQTLPAGSHRSRPAPVRSAGR